MAFKHMDAGGDHKGHRKVDQARNSEDFFRTVSLRNQSVCETGDVHQRNHTGQRCSLEQQDGFVPVIGQSISQSLRPDNSVAEKKSCHPDRTSGFDFTFRNGRDSSPDDFCPIR